MKGLLSLLVLATSAFGAVIEKRQFLSGLFSNKVEQPDRIIDVKPRVRPDAKRQLIRFGPFTLPAVKNATQRGQGGLLEQLNKPMDPNGAVLAFQIHDGVCTDCTILAGKADVVFEDNRRAEVADQVYLHHILVFDRSKRPGEFASFCPKSNNNFLSSMLGTANPLNSLFLGGAVNEYTTWYTTPDGKLDSGYYVKNSTFAVQSEVVNYRTTPQKVYMTLDLEYLPGKVGRDSLFTLLTVTGCNPAYGWFAKEAKNSLTSGQFPVLTDGTIINARGHLHDGGDAMEIFLNEKKICTSTAIYGGKGGTMVVDGKKWESISEMTDCDGTIPVKKGDYLKMKALYDLEKHPLRESHGGGHGEEMGIVTFSFVPTADKQAQIPPKQAKLTKQATPKS